LLLLLPPPPLLLLLLLLLLQDIACQLRRHLLHAYASTATSSSSSSPFPSLHRLTALVINTSRQRPLRQHTVEIVSLNVSSVVWQQGLPVVAHLADSNGCSTNTSRGCCCCCRCLVWLCWVCGYAKRTCACSHSGMCLPYWRCVRAWLAR
jgi:hypothetical protein